MIFHKTVLEGAYIIDLEPFIDERGLFARTFCKREFAAIGHSKEFVQFNHSHSNHQGTLRGLHYQRPPHAEIKLIRCIRGSVFDVIVDLRHQSPTFLQHLSVELSEQNLRMIYIPEGFAHGFQTLQDHTELIYHHTAFYAPDSDGAVRYNDPRINIQWPLTTTTISEKDNNIPFLAQTFEGLVI
jgi:dTDP-4-dehydrorhamnose 3,5-epimerase